MVINLHGGGEKSYVVWDPKAVPKYSLDLPISWTAHEFALVKSYQGKMLQHCRLLAAIRGLARSPTPYRSRIGKLTPNAAISCVRGVPLTLTERDPFLRCDRPLVRRKTR